VGKEDVQGKMTSYWEEGPGRARIRRGAKKQLIQQSRRSDLRCKTTSARMKKNTPRKNARWGGKDPQEEVGRGSIRGQD